MTRKNITRRRFVTGSLVAGAGLFILPHSRVLGANERINVAIMGCGGRGGNHMGWALKSGGNIVAVTDPDPSHMDKVDKAVKGKTVAKHQDFRKVLDMKEVDAMVIATPNHWHALGTVMACQAGKDVYVEKPASHSIWEGRKMVEAARKYNRMVQIGTQQRSDPALIELKHAMAAKELGEIHWIHALWYANRPPIGKTTTPTPVDKTLYDLWCGPRDVVPLMRKNLHYDWHWFWDYGNGDMGNRVIHNCDDVHHICQMQSIPTRAMAIGGRFKYDDDANTPNTEMIWIDWDIPIILESRNMPVSATRGGTSVYHRFNKNHRFTNIVKCDKGFFAATRGGGGVYDNDGKQIRPIKGDGGGKHMANFFDACRSRNYKDLNADVEQGHQSAAMIHLGNISYRIGKAAAVSNIEGVVSKHEEAAETFKQIVQHLKDNEVNLEIEKPTLGPWLTFDAKTEQFTGDHADQANQYVKESYRTPFVIPDQV